MYEYLYLGLLYMHQSSYYMKNMKCYILYLEIVLLYVVLWKLVAIFRFDLCFLFFIL